MSCLFISRPLVGRQDFIVIEAFVGPGSLAFSSLRICVVGLRGLGWFHEARGWTLRDATGKRVRRDLVS